MKLGSNRTAGERNRPAVLRWIDRLGESRLFRIVVCAFVARGQLYGGDILRPNGGASSAASASSASSSPGATPTPVTSMMTSAQDRLARTTNALAAVRAMQTAARAAAASGANNLGLNPNRPTVQLPDVPDGLGAGGLQVATDAGNNAVLWQGAKAPVQSASGNQTTVTVTQSQQQALLQWQTFNVGKNTTLAFDQSAGGTDVGNWIAFNYVRDPTGNPTQILGAIKTLGAVDASGTPQVGGQVYVMNSNGIIFGGSSQVNAHALVASSLPINYNLIQRGLLNNPDAQFLFSALPIASGSNGPTPTFDPAVAVSGVAPVQTPFAADGSGAAGGKYGDVSVQAGATLTAPGSASSGGGKIALIGPNVSNAGTISSPDGQVILAAGLQAGFAAHATSDPSLRGLDVYIGAVTNSAQSDPPAAGAATNAVGGLIDAPLADVAIAGESVNQLGVISGSTSVSDNGRIDLAAAYNAVSSGGVPNAPPFFWTATGTVNLGSSSLTQILPDLSDSSTIAGTTFKPSQPNIELALPSQINLTGANVQFAGSSGPNPGATLYAPNAQVTVNAGRWTFLNGGIDPSTGQLLHNSSEQFVFDEGDISLQGGAWVDVSGSENVSASVTDNVISVPLTATELANSPAQRNGPLRGQTIQIDIRNTGTYDGQPWVGTSLADTTGYVGLIQHTVGELTVDGGSVSFNAGGAVNLQSGSRIDVSGGWIDYQGGYVQTTKLLTTSGQIVDIAQATPNQVYKGIYTGTASSTDSKWGVTQTTANPVALGANELGYTQGGDAGSISIKAPAMTLGGSLVGLSFPGSQQTKPFVPYTASALQAVANAGIDPRVWELENQPMAGTLALVFEGQYAISSGSNQYAWYLPAPPDIYLQSRSSGAPADPNALVVSTSLVNAAASDYAGFGYLTIDNSSDSNKIVSSGTLAVDPATGQPPPALFGTITVAANPSAAGDVAIDTAPGGSITLDAGNIAIDGGIVVPGGQISLTAHNFWENSPYNALNFGLPSYNPGRGNLDLASGVTLNTAGLVIDDRTVAGAVVAPAVATGGSVTIAGSDVTLGSQSVIDVDGGGVIGANGKVTYGNAGSISIRAGADPNFGGILGGALDFNAGDQTHLAPTLKPFEGYSGSGGGSLTLGAPLIQVGTVAGTAVQPGTLQLSADFFNQGGFSSFTLNGIGQVETAANGQPLTDSAGNTLYFPAVYIAPGTQIHPRVTSLQIIPDGSGYQSEILAPFDYQETPVSLSLRGTGATNPLFSGLNAILARGDVLIGSGALIETDPQSNPTLGVTVSGQTVAVLGSVVVPGGSISIKGGADSGALFPLGSSTALPTVDLGPHSFLSTAGTTVLTSDYLGNTPGAAGYINTGSVLAGGAISLDGNIVAEAGSKLDVSGWSDANDPNGLLNDSPLVSGADVSSSLKPLKLVVIPTVVASNGGSITFTGRQELFVDATLQGDAGGPTAAGGRLSVSSGAFEVTSPLVPDLVVKQGGVTIPAAFYGPDQTAIGHAVLDASGSPVASLGYFTADNFTNGGFASLSLGGTVDFKGPVNIAAANSLTVGTSGVILADGEVNLSAGYVALGQPNIAPVQPLQEPAPYINDGLPIYFPPTYGGGTLNISAGSAKSPGLIDVGYLSLQNIGQTTLTAAGGDVRGFGTLDVAGSLTLTAGQVYAPTEETFTMAAYDYHPPSDPSGAAAHPGSITFVASGDRQIPLSAGSTLNVYASVIDQGGNLEAPIGTINLGWNGTGTAPIDPITNAAVPATQQLTLEPGSTTSVSGSLIDPATGKNIPIPYGLVLNGTSWIDPTGSDISSTGLPAKSLNLSASTINVTAGSAINTGGGGDLYAYQFAPGSGGTVDVLSASSGSFAVIPGYQATYAPDAGFNPNSSTSAATNFAAGDLGYTSVGGNGSSNLSVGQQVRLDLNNGLGIQTYTLLPARYALLPGAYLVTPVSGAALPPAQPAAQPDGSYVVSGYRFNAFDPTQPLLGEFNVASSSVVRKEAPYGDYSANTFFGSGGQSSASSSLRLPVDSGQLDISATGSLSLLGAVAAAPGTGGRGGLVDISSSEDIVINGTGTGSAAGTLYLSSSELSSFGSGSLLVGGATTPGAAGDLVNVTAGNLTVDNAGAPLTGSDIILLANQSLMLATGAEIQASGTLSSPVDNLVISDSLQLLPATGGFLNLTRGGAAVSFAQGTPAGDTIKTSIGATITLANGTTRSLAENTPTVLAAGSTVTLAGAGQITAGGTGGPIPVTLGDGAMLRVSADPAAQSTRTGVASSSAPTLQIGKGATVKGASVIVDSTNSTVVDPTAVLGGAVSLSSGQISLVFDNSLLGSAPANSLVLTGATLATFQQAATALSLLSYSSLDTYGVGQIGSPTFNNLVLDTAEIRGFQVGSGGSVALAAQTITLKNDLGGTAPGAASGATPNGNLVLNGGTVNLGANNVAIDQFTGVQINASGGVLAQATGSLTTPGNLTVTTPLLTAATGARQTVTAGGKLELDAPASGTSTITGGLGASLTLVGSSVSQNGRISLPSGTLTLHATGPAGSGADLTLSGSLDASGTAKNFNNATDYTNGGQINLVSDHGNVDLKSGAYVNVAAQAGGGSAGGLSVSAVNGTFSLASATESVPGQNSSPTPTLDARNGQGGTFSLDVENISDANGLATPSLGYLEDVLATGGFSGSQTVRVRTGDVAVDGRVMARTFNLSADKGSISLTGTGFVDASGPTGGNIELDAAGSVTLEAGSELSVRGQNFNDAGQGGTVTLQAGAYAGGSTAPPTEARGANGRFGAGTAVVDILRGSTIDLSVVNNHPLELEPAGGGTITVPADVGVFFPSGTPGNDTIAIGGGGTITTATGVTTHFIASALSPFKTTLTPGSTVTLGSAGTLAFSTGTGGSIPIALPYNGADGTPINLAAANVTDLAAYYSTGTLNLAAPQVFNSNASTGLPCDVQINPVAGTIRGLDQGSNIVLEGVKVFDLSQDTYGTPGSINSAVQLAVQNDGVNFAGGLLLAADGSTTPVVGNTPTILANTIGGNPALQSFFQATPNSFHVRPGAEIVNPKGDLTLSSTWDFTQGAMFNYGGDPSVASNWDLSGMVYRFGPGLNEPGFLGLRAAGNIVLGMDPSTGQPVSLNDAFAGYDGSDDYSLWQAVLLPAGVKSWSYQLTSGADLSGADGRDVLAASALAPGTGSILLGQGVPALAANPPPGFSLQSIIPQAFQTIRTGTGDVGLYAGANVEILNNLATIYTAGTQTDPVPNFTPTQSEYPAQYTAGGGNVTIVAQGDIAHLAPNLAADSSKELPTNWLYRFGWIDPTTGQFGSSAGDGVINSTSWWIDFSNFFEGVGALGGGNVTLNAGGNINNVDALVPTNARMTNQTTVVDAAGTTVDRLAADQSTFELGGGDLAVNAGGDINGGVYYVERGQGSLRAGGSILTNSTRSSLSQKLQLLAPQVVTSPQSWLPTTLFLGQGSFSVNATDDVLLGPVANPFLLPQASANGLSNKTYFSTYATSDVVSVSSLTGTVALKDAPDGGNGGTGGTGSLTDWFNQVGNKANAGSFAQQSEPWLGTVETNLIAFAPLAGLMPATLQATAFSGSINVIGTLTLSPAPSGQVAFAAENSISGMQPNTVNLANLNAQWGSSVINLSNAAPAAIPGIATPLALAVPDTGLQYRDWQTTSTVTLGAIGSLFAESGSYTGSYAVIQTQQLLNGAGPLHANDPQPVQLYAANGDISGLTLYAGKSAQVVAGRDITDIALYVENNQPGQLSSVVAGRDLIAYDPTSALRTQAQTSGNQLVSINATSVPASGTPTAGDIQIGGPGTLEVLAGRNLDLGIGPAAPNGTSVGITSIGNSRDPYLPFGGADIIVASGIGGLSALANPSSGLNATGIDFSSFIAQYLAPSTAGAFATQYLPELATMLGVTVAAGSTPQQIWAALLGSNSKLPAAGQAEQEDRLALDTFYLVLRDTGRNFNNPASPGAGTYSTGYDAIKTLFPGSQLSVSDPSGPWTGNLSLATRLIETTNGGDISVLAPGGQVTVGQSSDPQKPDQGVLTEDGGDISIFARNDVNVGTSRIFTLHGGNEIIWSNLGSIAAGSGSRTVHAAPPTRVLVDPQSANVQNDLAGLATGSGIGVLATLIGVAAGSVDLIAPVGTIDAGEAGIRASGSINIAALHVLNATNIQAGGTATGIPVVAAPNISGLTSASNSTAAVTSAATAVAAGQQSATQAQEAEIPSIINVEVLGYGGEDDSDT